MYDALQNTFDFEAVRQIRTDADQI